MSRSLEVIASYYRERERELGRRYSEAAGHRGRELARCDELRALRDEYAARHDALTGCVASEMANSARFLAQLEQVVSEQNRIAAAAVAAADRSHGALVDLIRKRQAIEHVVERRLAEGRRLERRAERRADAGSAPDQPWAMLKGRVTDSGSP